jgi:hypothetical protein
MRTAYPNPDLDTESLFPSGHCEVVSTVPARRSDVPARRRGNLIVNGEIASVPSQ